MLSNETILNIAMEQSATDLSARAEDFLKNDNVVVISKPSGGARRYLSLPFSCQLVSYGNNVVASVSEEYRELVEDYLGKYPTEHIFETPHMHVLNEALMKRGQKICFMAEYFLPDVSLLRPLECPYELRILTREGFSSLYLPEWSNALCKDRSHLDELAVGAYDSGRLIGLAGCSRDSDTMWQIGIDVLPEYRRSGVASALTSRLAIEILERGKVPFYCAAWCNIGSVRNAIKSGFRPAWVEMTAKSCETVDKLNDRMKKIIVLGCPGSGKTTFSKKLHEKTGLPLFHLDAIWHRPDKTHISREEYDTRISEILELDSWIIDGNYSRTIETRLAACDTVFLFDLPTEVCLDGAVSRIGRKRADMPWVETELDPDFKRQIEEFRDKSLPAIYELTDRYRDGRKVVIFKSREEADAFLKSLGEDAE